MNTIVMDSELATLTVIIPPGAAFPKRASRPRLHASVTTCIDWTRGSFAGQSILAMLSKLCPRTNRMSCFSAAAS